MVSIGAFIVLAVIGYFVQRRYFSTCTQTANHIAELAKEVNEEMPVVGAIRQQCEDDAWGRHFRRELMRADTVSQVRAVFDCLQPDGDKQLSDQAACTEIWLRLPED